MRSRIEQYEREGWPRTEAERRARQRVGNLAVHHDRGYDVRGGGIMETIVQDVRYAVRQLLRERGFSIVAILTLTLGIGASTALFSVIDAAMLTPLPYPDPEQLVTITVETPQLSGRSLRVAPSLDEIQRWQNDFTDVFSSIAASRNVGFGGIVDEGEPERVEAHEITEDYLRMHGTAPIVGRDLTRDDMRPGAPAVVLLGHGYCQRRYGSDRNVLGKTIRYDDDVATIVGVLPSSFGSNVPIWRPLRFDPPSFAFVRGTGISVSGRLRPGLTLKDAGERLSARLPPDEQRTGPAVPVKPILASRVDDVLGAAIALTVTSGVLFGFVPAFRLSGVRIGAAMARGNPRSGAALSRRGGHLLIASEVALAMVLLAGAGLMIRSFARLMAIDVGFEPEKVVTMRVVTIDPAPRVQEEYYPALLRTLRATPGIAAVGAVDHLPLGGSSTTTSARVDGKWTSVGLRQFLPGYFEALGLPLRMGRLPTEADYAAGKKAAVINESAAKQMFPDAPPPGRRFSLEKTEWEVIGVVADVRHGGPLRNAGPEVYLSFTPSEHAFHRGLALTIVVRPAEHAPRLAEQLRRAAQDVGPRVLVERIRSGHELLGQMVITPRRRTVLLGLLGVLGLVLALVGVFGMASYSVTRRTVEIGVRMAFGARPGQVVAGMVRDSAIPIVLGTLVGLGGAAAATRLIASFLFQTDPTDATTLAAVAVTLTATGCVAAWLPSRRAARVDPVTALRAE